MPPVGLYNSVDLVKVGTTKRGWSMGHKEKWRPSNTNPSPTEYNPNIEVILENTNPTRGFSKSGQKDSYRLKFPQYATEKISAASYNTSKPFGHGSKRITIGKKLQTIDKQKSPAPGHY